MKFKFNVGDLVKLVADSRQGEILTVLYDSDNGIRYRVSMNSIDFTTNQITKGAITLSEDELELTEDDK